MNIDEEITNILEIDDHEKDCECFDCKNFHKIKTLVNRVIEEAIEPLKDCRKPLTGVRGYIRRIRTKSQQY